MDFSLGSCFSFKDGSCYVLTFQINEVYHISCVAYEKLIYVYIVFCRMLSMYEIEDEDIDSVVDLSQLSTGTQPSSLQMQLPVLELLKVGVSLLVCLTPNVYTSTSNVSLCFGKVVGNSESYVCS
jgi:hypothetical protein